MDKQYIFMVTARNVGGKRQKHNVLFDGTLEQARNSAKICRENLLKEGCTDARVEIWQVVATSYKGTIRR